MVDWTDRIGRRIKLRDLHILLAVAKSGSMGKPQLSWPFPNRSFPRRSPTSNTKWACLCWIAVHRASSLRHTVVRSLNAGSRCLTTFDSA